MLQTVDVGERSLSAYDGVAPDPILEQLRQVAEEIRGSRILHVNATPYGGGVSELLRSVVPLMNDLGIVTEWRIISGDGEFFDVTKKIHNGLQGGDIELTDEEKHRFEATGKANAEAMKDNYDAVFIHDPQPAPILGYRGNSNGPWVWRCHIDTGEPNPGIWQYCRQFLGDYAAAIFTMGEFVPPDFPVGRVEIMPPAIDPLSPKNMSIANSTARHVLDWIGVRLNKPLITQVSRFDSWKDPLGVIEAYRLARREVPDLQLALVGSMALDDPEGWDIYREVDAARANDPLIHVFTNLTGVGNIEVNAFQRLSDVCVQKSIREGFGLVVSESLWKGTPMVAGRAGGIPLQMSDGVGGILVDGITDCAQAIVKLLRDPDLAHRLGESGRERVREHFLLPRLLLNELSLVRDLLLHKDTRSAEMLEGRDPVCGMAIADAVSAVFAYHKGRKYVFCSDLCKESFLREPERYVHGERDE